MDTVAAVMTGKSSAAIAAIAVEGSKALDICRLLTANRLLTIDVCDFKLCNVVSEGKIVDEVLIAREGEQEYVINCHGNPLITKQITAKTVEFGAKLLGLQEFTHKKLSEKYGRNSIAAEINMLYTRQLSLPATHLIYEQGKGGLSAFIDYWLGSDRIDISQFHEQCCRIIEDSHIAGCILNKQKIVLFGLPNSGKSTLFNCFCGKNTAIVADFHGTTRDWLKAGCSIGDINAELFDTAGFNGSICNNIVDEQSQQRTQSLIPQADMVIMVVDAADAANPKQKQIEEVVCSLGTPLVLKVYNKIDKIDKVDYDGILISAIGEEAAETVGKAIVEAFGVQKITPKTAIYFTQRQKRLLEDMADCKSSAVIRQKLDELKTGDLNRDEIRNFQNKTPDKK